MTEFWSEFLHPHGAVRIAARVHDQVANALATSRAWLAARLYEFAAFVAALADRVSGGSTAPPLQQLAADAVVVAQHWHGRAVVAEAELAATRQPVSPALLAVHLRELSYAARVSLPVPMAPAYEWFRVSLETAARNGG